VGVVGGGGCVWVVGWWGCGGGVRWCDGGFAVAIEEIKFIVGSVLLVNMGVDICMCVYRM